MENTHSEEANENEMPIIVEPGDLLLNQGELALLVKCLGFLEESNVANEISNLEPSEAGCVKELVTKLSDTALEEMVKPILNCF